MGVECEAHEGEGKGKAGEGEGKGRGRLRRWVAMWAVGRAALGIASRAAGRADLAKHPAR